MENCNCNCNLRIGRGNDFTIEVEMRHPTVKTVEDFDLKTCTDITCSLVSRLGRHIAVDYEITDDGKLRADFDENVPLGVYGFEVTGKSADGQDWRFFAKPGEWLEIVNASSDENDPEANGKSYYEKDVTFGVVTAAGDMLETMQATMTAFTDAEQKRVEAEDKRIEAEAGRVSAEAERERKSNNAVEQAKTATEAANKAALDARQLVGITYSELKALRDGGKLVPGRMYRITDYATTTTQADTRSAGHPFDIIVTADSATKLNEHAHAIQHAGDTYFAKSNLQVWQVWYTLDNNTAVYAWADTANGKGVIYRLIDEFGNDCPYDFKNIQFKRYKITSTTNESMKGLVGSYQGTKDVDSSSMYPRDCTISTTDTLWCFTFRSGQSGDLSLDGTVCHHNVISAYRRTSSPGNTVLNSIVLHNRNANPKCHSNRFAAGCRNFTAGFDFYSNTFGDSCYSNTFRDSCYSNTFGDYCYSNTFGDSCYINTFGNYCNSNTFGNYCCSNTFGNYCYSNTFGDSCYSNTFGNDCDSNTFGNDCDSNTFGNHCHFNNADSTMFFDDDSESGGYTLEDNTSRESLVSVSECNIDEETAGDNDEQTLYHVKTTLTSPSDRSLTVKMHVESYSGAETEYEKKVELKANEAQDVEFVTGDMADDGLSNAYLDFQYEHRGKTIKYYSLYIY